MHHAELRMLRCAALALAAGLVTMTLGGAARGQGTFVPMNPRATYLHTNQDSALNAVPVSLASIGAEPGDRMLIDQLGDFDPGPGGDASITTIAVFSATNVLLPAGMQHRVPDAVNAGREFSSACTFNGCQPTDIPQDFLVSSVNQERVCLRVPAGAAWLFVASHDSLYQDNTDPDGDFGVAIEVTTAGDADCNGVVNFEDVLLVLGDWGDCPAPPAGCPGDLDDNGVVSFEDLLVILADWGH